MKLDLDTEIRYPDGERAGVLRRVILGPDNQVSQVVMATDGLVSRNVLVPMSMLSEGPGGVLNINATPDDVDGLEDYEEEEFPAVPEGWEFNQDAIPGGDVFPATFYQPIIPVMEIPNIDEDEISLSQGTEVWCLDGRWGIVDEVIVGDDGRVTAFVARSDAENEHNRLVPIELVQSVDNGVADLGCTIADLPTYTQEIVDPEKEPEVE